VSRDVSALKKNLEELSTGNTGKLLLKYSWPALVATTLNALYAVVDRVFIGKGCGVDAMAGLQLAMAPMMFLTAFGPLIGVGHAAVLSIKLGAGDADACEKLVGETVALKVLLYVVLIPALYLCMDGVLAFCGADKVTPGAYAAAKQYLQIVLCSHLFSHLAFGLSALQRAEGAAIKSMNCMLVGFGANLVLDPLLIFGIPVPPFLTPNSSFLIPPMGIAGAAWATDVAMLASCLWAFGYYWRGKTVVRLRLRRIGVYRDLVGRTLAIGLAPFLMQLMSSLIIASLGYAFAKWMPTEAARTDQIASLGVFSAALILVFMPIQGAQQGLQPILGFNWGARNFDRVLGTLKMGIWVTTGLTFLAWLVQVVPPFPEWITRMFVSADNPALIRLCVHDLQVSNSMIWCISLNVVATTYYQSIGRPAVAIWLSMLRQGFVLLPIVWILPYFMEDKSLAIWLSVPISDVICNVATVPPLLLHARFLKRVRAKKATSDAPRA